MIFDCNDVYIVTGLPRSGTSLCMRMLEAGGMPVLTDNLRTPNDDNPNGYYEYEPVKKTRDDPSWLELAKGKAVKMVYRLLYDLPKGYEYRVLFMRRDLDEVLVSQQKMLKRVDNCDSSVSDAEMHKLFQQQLQDFTIWLHAQPHFGVLEINYNELLDSSSPVLRGISKFLDDEVDCEAMGQVMNPALYRNRRASPAAT